LFNCLFEVIRKINLSTIGFWNRKDMLVVKLIRFKRIFIYTHYLSGGKVSELGLSLIECIYDVKHVNGEISAVNR